MVGPVVQRAGAGEKVEVFAAVGIPQVTAAGPVEQRRPRSAITAYLRFEGVKNGHVPPSVGHINNGTQRQVEQQHGAGDPARSTTPLGMPSPRSVRAFTFVRS